MRIAITVLRYGEDIAGGAEQLARGLAEQAAHCGWTVEVWTTCARSHYTWENVYPPGAQTLNGVCVRRFPITWWDHVQRAQLELRLRMLGTLSFAEQEQWLATGAHSAPLYHHIAAHGCEFDAVVALPYALPLAHYAAWSAPERVILLPCLHDEAYAYLACTRLLMESVRGVIFNSPEERDLAVATLGMRPRRHAILGAGVTLPTMPEISYEESPRDLLYVGRLEHGKNVHVLYGYMRQSYDEGSGVRLVVIGDGPVQPPAHPAFAYRGFVAERDKSAAYGSALALCQPSINESFSFTLMEAWLHARPVLVNQLCAVTQGHVLRCDGGLMFRDYLEFTHAIEWFKQNSARAHRMGERGRAYVQKNFEWASIVDKFARIVADWQAA